MIYKPVMPKKMYVNMLFMSWGFQLRTNPLILINMMGKKENVFWHFQYFQVIANSLLKWLPATANFICLVYKYTEAEGKQYGFLCSEVKTLFILWLWTVQHACWNGLFVCGAQEVNIQSLSGDGKTLRSSQKGFLLHVHLLQL